MNAWMRRAKRKAAIAVALVLGLAGMLPVTPDARVQAEELDQRVVFAEGLGDGFTDYSWGDRSFTERGVVHQGSVAIRFNPSLDNALYLYSSSAYLLSDYNTLEFWIHGGSLGGQKLNVIIQAGGQEAAKVDLGEYLAEGRLAADWQKVQVDLTKLKIPSGVFDGIMLGDQSHGHQEDVYIDDIRLVRERFPVSDKQPAPISEQIVVFDDRMRADFTYFGSPASSLLETTTVHAGTYAASLVPGDGHGIYFYKDRVLSTTEYKTLEFWVHGGTEGGQQLDLTIQAGGQSAARIEVEKLLTNGTIAAGEWRKASIALDTLDLPGEVFDGLLFQGRGDGSQPAVYLDDLVIVKETYEQPRMERIAFPAVSLVVHEGGDEPPLLKAFYDNGYVESQEQGVSWSSGQPDIAAVENGRLKAYRTGSTVVTATYETFAASLQVQVVQVEPEPVYDDRLREGFDNWSWGTVSLTDGTVVRSGSQAIRFAPRWWQGVYIDHEEGFEARDYYGFEFYVHGGDLGKQKLRFVVQDMNTILGSVVLDELLPDGIRPGVWQKVTVRLADLGITEGYFDSFVVQAWDWREQEPVYIDDIQLLRYKDRRQNPKPVVHEVDVRIDPSANRRAINPDIYGVNFEEIEPQDMSSFTGYPVVRWGGNSTTRYNWETNVQNHASDWFYMNLPKTNSPNEQLPHGSRTDQLIDKTLGDGGKVLLTVPTIGWTPKDREVRTGYSVSKYGQQQQTECSWGDWWCNPDAGNGIRPDGSYIAGNDPHDTSKPVGPDFAARWIDHIQSRVGDQVNYYALDNEPMLWPYTHRDIHPEMTTYDEVWTYTRDYGQAIKQADPDGQIFGPVVWGWCAYFYSASDGCAPGPDRQAHGGKPFLEWYLEQVRKHEQTNGTRLVDYLDIHYYPTESGVALSADESNQIAARRLRSLKALYDPSFKDSSSWIGEPVNLIPRMKELIGRTAPGTKLAITEYNFGNGRGISSGLAQAEAMAIFGREGVDLATRWGQPLANTPVEDAFKLFLDYDGQGGKIEGFSVKADSSNVDMVGSYAVQGPDGKLYVLLFNKDPLPKQANVQIDGYSGARKDVYRFDASNRLAHVGSLEAGAGYSVELPGRSATLIVTNP
ncbi:Glycoside hydrolase family 44 [Paenibacillus sp. UNCCL117]|uniref:glycoside hydrolase family 44 protein n=1 Tax=unclassified Paenibacillus TaxID=185978 RepID=UPI00088B241C|nr:MULTISPECIES: glycoside hydrolase family 44 protein [unclassified Paenibacillus]SDC48514.1 Glycoside hydrolase family 44 [Paenibacillus sp. cl123]SFW11920.1 Glycoside hydrolase family 44 [Paenibacillus sp. UNCCL117]